MNVLYIKQSLRGKSLNYLILKQFNSKLRETLISRIQFTIFNELN